LDHFHQCWIDPIYLSSTVMKASLLVAGHCICYYFFYLASKLF